MEPARRPEGGPVSRLAGWARRAPASLVVALLPVLWLGWIELHGSSTDAPTLVRFGALERSRVWSGEPWRLLSAALVHAGWLHLFWNVVFGVPWCRLVERAMGSGRFLAVYAASTVGASSLSLLGQDTVSVGASGALFGAVGAVLALHGRALGSWREFAASQPARRILGSILVWSLLGALFLRLDHLAHAGGLLTGATGIWVLTGPAPRRAARVLGFLGVLAALATAASWPRGGTTRFQAAEEVREIHAALRADDLPLARRLLDGALARGDPPERVLFYRALVLAQEGELAGALDVARPLARSEDPAVREEARTLARDVAKLLGYRHYTGDGAVRDPILGLLYLEEACSLGDPESCENVRRIRGR